MAGQNPKDDKDITIIAQKQRYLSLLKRVKSNQTLSKAELSELQGYEKEFKEIQQSQKSKKSRRIKKKRGKLTQADCQRLGYDYADIAEADKAAGLSANLSKYLSKHPKLRQAYDRGRLLKALSETAPNSLIYEAATQLKHLGFTQFKTGQDIRNFLDSDPEANELWETARVRAAIENRKNLRAAAGGGNVKAIELLDKLLADRQKETSETGVSFNRIGVNQMAELFGVTRTTIYEWRTQKAMPVNVDGSFDLHTAIPWFEDYTLKKAVRGREAISALNPFQTVKTERERLKLEQDRGELIGREAFIAWRCAILQNIVNAFNAITDLANRVFGQTREEIVDRLEEFRDDVMAKLQHVPAELKLSKEAQAKLMELYEIIGPETGDRDRNKNRVSDKYRNSKLLPDNNN